MLDLMKLDVLVKRQRIMYFVEISYCTGNSTVANKFNIASSFGKFISIFLS